VKARTRELLHLREVARPGAYARARVRDLDRSLVQALNRARALDYQLSRGRVHELTVALARDLHQVRLQASEFELELDLEDDRARHLVRGLTRQRDFALIDDYDRSGHMARARALARLLGDDLDQVRSLAEELAAAHERADSRHFAYARQQTPAADAGGGEPAVAPARMAAGLVAHAVRVLPAAHQGRWREEFDAELLEFAEAVATRRTQLRHAVRVAGRAWSLRRALQSPSPAEGRA
jgi:hypothetical protein